MFILCACVAEVQRLEDSIDYLELELQVVVGVYLMWVLRTEFLTPGLFLQSSF